MEKYDLRSTFIQSRIQLPKLPFGSLCLNSILNLCFVSCKVLVSLMLKITISKEKEIHPYEFQTYTRDADLKKPALWTKEKFVRSSETMMIMINDDIL